MAGLRNSQQIIEEGKCYLLRRSTGNYQEIQPSFFIRGSGSIDIYASEETPASKTDMFKMASDLKEGYQNFIVIPNYLYIEQNGAGTRTIILTGFEKPALEIF